MSLKVAIGYARSSSASNPKSSIPNQIGKIKEYCERNNILLKEVFVDEQKSGTKADNRDEYQLLRKEIRENNKLDMVIVAYSDRLARDAYEFVSVVEEAKKHNKAVVSVAEGMNSQENNAMTPVFMGILAEIDNKNRNERVQSSKRNMLKQGIYFYPSPPFGYIFNDEKRLIKHEEQGRVVLDIFNYFNKDGGYVRTHQYIIKKYPVYIDQLKLHVVKKILKTKTYTGFIYPINDDKGDYERLSDVKHEQIISEDLFAQVQLRRNILKRPQSSKPQRLILFSNGTLLCSSCNESLKYYYKSDGYYYCGNKCMRIQREIVEKKVLEALVNQNATNQNIGRGKLDSLYDRKKQLEKKFATAVVSYDSFVRQLEKINNEIKMTHIEQRTGSLLHEETYADLIRKGNLKSLKKALITDGIKVIINNDGSIKVIEAPEAAKRKAN